MTEAIIAELKRRLDLPPGSAEHLTKYGVAKKIGLKWESVRNFVEGKQLRSSTIDKLGELLHCQVSFKPPPKPSKRPKP